MDATTPFITMVWESIALIIIIVLQGCFYFQLHKRFIMLQQLSDRDHLKYLKALQALVMIAHTYRGYPNGSTEGETARTALYSIGLNDSKIQDIFLHKVK